MFLRRYVRGRSVVMEKLLGLVKGEAEGGTWKLHGVSGARYQAFPAPLGFCAMNHSTAAESVCAPDSS